MFSINLEDVDDGRNVVRMKRMVSILGDSRNLLLELRCFLENQIFKLLKLQSYLGSKLRYISYCPLP